MVSDNEPAQRYFAEPSNYLRNNPYIALRARTVRDLLEPITETAILDIGAGDAAISRQFLDDETNRLTLLDASPRMLDVACGLVPHHQRARVDVIHADLASFQPSQRYGLVICIGVLAHVPTWRRALSVVASCVARGGTCVLQITDAATLNGRLTYGTVFIRNLVRHAAYETTRMTFAEVAEAAKDVGLEVREVTRYAFVPGLRSMPPSISAPIVNAMSHGFWRRHGGETLLVLRAS